jgi:hypothetical protein
MPPDAGAPPPPQLPLPLALPTAPPPPPPPAGSTTRPEQVWGGLGPELRARVRQAWLKVRREEVDDVPER